MSISLTQAMFFVPKNEKWIRRTLFGSMLLFFPTFAYLFPGIRRLIFNPLNYYFLSLFLLLTLFVSVVVCGYFFKTVHNRIIHLDNSLPSWRDFHYYFYIGCKAYLGGLVLAIPFLLLQCFIWFFSPLTFDIHLIPYALLSFGLHVIYTVLYIMAALNFSQKFNISAFWDIKRAYSLVSHNISNFLVLVFYSLLLGISSFLIVLVLVNCQILALLIPFLSFYICLIYTDLFAQFVTCNDEVNINEKECIV
jgi:hypothetical protein